MNFDREVSLDNLKELEVAYNEFMNDVRSELCESEKYEPIDLRLFLFDSNQTEDIVIDFDGFIKSVQKYKDRYKTEEGTGDYKRESFFDVYINYTGAEYAEYLNRTIWLESGYAVFC